jgi:hypothetical protein
LKKLAAILLIGLLFFNWYGYRLLTACLETRADHQLESRLDNDNYDESQLISIKIPSTYLSYYNSSTRFERVDGQIEIGGIKYKYVKRRLFNDSLELLCIPNNTAMQLQQTKDEFFKLTNDIQQHNGQDKRSGSHPGAAKSFSSIDYYATGDPFTMGDLYALTLPKPLPYTDGTTSSYSRTAEQPPDLHYNSRIG